MEKVGRNDPCPCGSGKKYKNCCLQKKQQQQGSSLGKRKFTAKVLTKGVNQSENRLSQEQAQEKAAIDYAALMERSFGKALHTHEDKPPIVQNPSDYLASDQTKEPASE